jgi:tetratricopeptide (TPR) repeat protein
MKAPLKWLVCIVFGVLIVRELVLMGRPSAELRGDARVLEIHGSVASMTERGDRLDITLFGTDARFRINGGAWVARLGLLKGKNSREPITLRVYLEGARISARDGRPEYWVESVAFRGRSHGKYSVPAPGSGGAVTSEIASLLRGFALEAADQHAAAIDELDAAIGSGRLDDRKLAIAYLARGNAHEYLAYDGGSTEINDRDDRLLLNARSDYQRLAELESSSRGLTGQARTLDALGAYPESLGVSAEILRRWPDEFYRVAVRRSATLRLMGDYPAALAALDDMVTKHGPQGGMMFHYHRGWTLLELQRYAEAAREFSAGLEDQPGYYWAIRKRACAYAQLGDLEHALADAKQAVKLWSEQVAGMPPAANHDAVRGRLEAMVVELEGAPRAGPQPMRPEACSTLDTGPRAGRRERSRLLGVPAVES